MKKLIMVGLLAATTLGAAGAAVAQPPGWVGPHYWHHHHWWHHRHWYWRHHHRFWRYW